MKPRWLAIATAATALVFAAVAIYVYGFRFFAWLESDAAVQLVLPAKLLHAHSPILTDWYYVNGDIWFLTPHLLALLPIAILGAGPWSLWIAVLLGFVIELVLLAYCYRRLGGTPWIALVAAMATLMAWSSGHVAFEYLQLAYGWVTCLYLIAFTWFATLALRAEITRWQLAGVALFIAATAVQNPTRAIVFMIAPVLASCVWPWRGIARRRRVVLAVAAIAGWIVAYAVYTWVLSPAVEFSRPRGHVGFAIGDLGANLAMFGRGMVFLTGGLHGTIRSVPGIALVLSALAIVIREVLSREPSASRFVAVAAIAQLGVVMGPLVLGNLLDGMEATRYVMPCLVAIIGLAVVIAVRMLDEPSWWRRVAIGWLVLVPIAAAVAALDARPPRPRHYIWPNAPELAAISDELVRRDLTHGFSIAIAANLLTVDSSGAAKTCPITFRDRLRPQRWLTDTECFEALPDRFYVVLYQADGQDHVAAAATLPPPNERFSVGPTYEVFVYRTAETSTAWLGDTSP